MVAISQIIPLLPADYEEKCYNLGIIQRQRMIKNPADLMLFMFISFNKWLHIDGNK